MTLYFTLIIEFPQNFTCEQKFICNQTFQQLVYQSR